MTAPRQPSEWPVYFDHIVGLVTPNRRVAVFTVHTAEPKELTGWTDEDYRLLIDEGRRQLDRQIDDLAELRGRAQFLVTTGLASLTLIFATVRTVADADGPAAFLLWIASIGLALLGSLGAASVVVSRKEMGTIDAALLTHQAHPILADLAPAYGRIVRVGENTIATQITVFRKAVFLVIGAVLLLGCAWTTAVV